MSEIYKRYRPKTFGDVVGQTDAVRTLVSFGKSGKIPHFLLFVGPSGCGKTTLARIVRDKMKCDKADFIELNASDHRGVDTIRDIRRSVNHLPLGGGPRIWLIDECHALTADAQNAFLKLLEDTPDHVYFMLATTDPQKLKKTIKTRATEIVCRSIEDATLTKLINKVTEDEKASPLTDAVINALIQAADGSARKALVELDKVLQQDTEEAQLAVITASEAQRQGFEIAQALMKGESWSKVSKLIKNVSEEPETVRRIILGYFNTVLLNSGNRKAAMMIDEFRDHWYDCGKSGLTVSCYHVLHN